MDETITYAWAPIDKAERQEDGSVIVTGVLTDAGLDRDGQAMAQEWLDRAVPKWFEESGNIREQHDVKRAAGVGTGLVRRQDGAYVLQSRIVDPVAALKCLPGPNGTRPVYQGYSIGVREPRLSFEKSEFPGGLVVDGYICESSLADRPSNPRSLFLLAKADGPDQQPQSVGKELPGRDDGTDGVTRKKPKGHKEPDGDEGQGLPGDGDGDEDEVSKAQDPELRKDWAEFDAKRKAGQLGTAVKDAAGHAGSIKVGDIAAAHHEGKTIIGHVAEIHGGSHVSIQHSGGTTKVPRDAVSHLRQAEPPKLSEQAMRSVPGPGSGISPEPGTPGAAAAALSPEARQRARLAEQHAETQRQGNQAMGEGMFAAAIRQAEAAAARRTAGAKAQVPDLLKFVSAKQRAKYAESGIAMPNGDFPIADRDHLSSALGLLGNYKGDKAAARAHIKRRAAALGVDVDLDGDGAAEKLAAAAELVKAAGWIVEDLMTKGGTPDELDEVEAMDKAELQSMINAAITKAVTGAEERMGDKFAALASRLDKVEASPAPGGPVQVRSSGQAQLAKNHEVKALGDEIAFHEQQAQLLKAEDPVLARGYQEKADQLRQQLVTR